MALLPLLLRFPFSASDFGFCGGHETVLPEAIPLSGFGFLSADCASAGGRSCCCRLSRLIVSRDLVFRDLFGIHTGYLYSV
jgi:hypothetical protein